VIPLVTASEQGKAQTENLVELIFGPNCSLSNLIIIVDPLQKSMVFFPPSSFHEAEGREKKSAKDPWKGTA